MSQNSTLGNTTIFSHLAFHFSVLSALILPYFMKFNSANKRAMNGYAT